MERFILVVDDEKSMRELLKEVILLYVDNYQIVEAEDGKEALQICQEHLPALIVTDLRMPRMGGLEFARNVRLNLSTEIPIILISGEEEDTYLGLLRGAGINRYFKKPFDIEELGKVITELLPSS